MAPSRTSPSQAPSRGRTGGSVQQGRKEPPALKLGLVAGHREKSVRAAVVQTGVARQMLQLVGAVLPPVNVPSDIGIDVAVDVQPEGAVTAEADVTFGTDLTVNDGIQPVKMITKTNTVRYA